MAYSVAEVVDFGACDEDLRPRRGRLRKTELSGVNRMTNDPQETYLPVVCPLCRTRMHARLDQVGNQLTCPDCGTVCPVLPPAQARPAPKRADPGEYGMRESGAFGDPTAIRTTPPPAAKSLPLPPGEGGRRPGEGASRKVASSPRPQQPAVILVTCPLCHTRMHPPLSDRGKRIKCPDCGTVVQIPTKFEVPRTKTAPDLVEGHYDMGAAPAAALPRVDMLVKASSLPTPPPVADAPRWTMFSGVFSFPWQREARLRWLYMTIGFLASCELLAFVWHFSGMATGTAAAGGAGGGGLAVGALGIVVLWLLIWTGSFAAACLVSVARETAAGVDQVDEWPESDWREWLWPALYLVDVVCVSCGVAYGLISTMRSVFATEHSLLELLPTLLVPALVPVLLLSVFDNGTILRPYSWPVLRSLVRLPHYWLLFQLETMLPLAALTALALLGLGGWAFYAALMFAPLMSAYVLIYARLLGRLAWHVGELEEEMQRRRASRDSH